MMHDVLNLVAQVSVERMMDSLLIGLALAAFAWTLLRLFPRQNSATRFSIWFAALIGTVVLPLIDAGSNLPAAQFSPALHPLISLPSAWALYLFGTWAAIAAIAIMRFACGFLELRRLRRSCRPVDVREWPETVARFCPGREVEILTCDRIHVPTAFGFVRPAVVIPIGLPEELSAGELHQVLLHELAHLRRWDNWTNVVQKLVKALLFFHPAVWWMEERISLEREMACDDAVLAEYGSPRAYAECLAHLAERSVLRRTAALAQAAVHRIRQTSLRVAQILDVNRPQAAPARKSAVALLAGFACAFLVVVWHAPRLVAFQDRPPALARTMPAPVMQQPVAGVNDAARQPVPTMAERRASPPKILQAKATFTDAARKLRQQQRTPMQVAERQTRAARVIQATVSLDSPPALVTGVLVVFVDDPVFGPTPILWHFAVWQVAPPQQAPQTEPATHQKSI